MRRLGVAACALIMAQGITDGEEAVARARHVLAGVGIGAVLELTNVSRSKPGRGADHWWVGFKDVFVTLDPASGRPIWIQRRAAEPPPSAAQDPTDASDRRASRAIRHLGYESNVSAPSEDSSRTRDSVTFYVLVNGLRFFNLNPRYGHWLTFVGEHGPLRDFVASAPVPPVNASKPRVTAARAERRIRAWMAEREKQTAIPLAFPHQVWEPELGYWKAHGDQTARLVWRLAGYCEVAGLRRSAGAQHLLVDAVTGRDLQDDDRSWDPAYNPPAARR